MSIAIASQKSHHSILLMSFERVPVTVDYRHPQYVVLFSSLLKKGRKSHQKALARENLSVTDGFLAY